MNSSLCGLLLVVLVAGVLAGCDRVGTPAPTPTRPPTATATVASSPTATPTAVPTATATPIFDLPDVEAIAILSPGPGSRVVSPLIVSGEANPTFEQTLVVRLVLDDGTELALVPAQIMADIGQRGPFEASVPFSVAGERQAFLQVFDVSARDGGTIHLASIGLTIAAGGAEVIVPVTPAPERIAISQPVPGATISGGLVQVAGIAVAGFEQTLVLELYDEDGSLLAQEPVIVAAPDLGQPGPFSAELAYTVAGPMPGRVVVRDPSPAFGGDAHLASVEIRLEP